MNYNQEVTDYIHTASSAQKEILELLRALIHKSIQGVSEEIKWNMPVFRKTKDFAYLRYSKNHSTIGFYNIELIDDPNNILEGSGTIMKHLKIKKKEDINQKLISTWLKTISK